MIKIPQPTVILVFIILTMACNKPTDSTHAERNQANVVLPGIKETNGVKQLYVNNKPVLIFGA